MNLIKKNDEKSYIREVKGEIKDFKEKDNISNISNNLNMQSLDMIMEKNMIMLM